MARSRRRAIRQSAPRRPFAAMPASASASARPLSTRRRSSARAPGRAIKTEQRQFEEPRSYALLAASRAPPAHFAAARGGTPSGRSNCCRKRSAFRTPAAPVSPRSRRCACSRRTAERRASRPRHAIHLRLSFRPCHLRRPQNGRVAPPRAHSHGGERDRGEDVAGQTRRRRSSSSCAHERVASWRSARRELRAARCDRVSGPGRVLPIKWRSSLELRRALEPDSFGESSAGLLVHCGGTHVAVLGEVPRMACGRPGGVGAVRAGERRVVCKQVHCGSDLLPSRKLANQSSDGCEPIHRRYDGLGVQFVSRVQLDSNLTS